MYAKFYKLYHKFLYMCTDCLDCQEWWWLCLYTKEILWKAWILCGTHWPNYLDHWCFDSLFLCDSVKFISTDIYILKGSMQSGYWLYRSNSYTIYSFWNVFRYICSCCNVYTHCWSMHEKRLNHFYENEFSRSNLCHATNLIRHYIFLHWGQ